MMYSNSFLAKASNWFLLGVILVVFLVPSMAIGTVDRSMGQEGDPTDGMDFAGGGGSPDGAEYPNGQNTVGYVPIRDEISDPIFESEISGLVRWVDRFVVVVDGNAFVIWLPPSLEGAK